VVLAAAGLSGCQPVSLDGFLYTPTPAPPGGYDLSTDVIPRFEEVRIATPDGESLDAVFVPSNGAHPDVTLIYFHGQSANIGSAWERMEYLYPLGYNLFMVDPRGWGLSTGTPSEPGIKIDIRSAHDYLIGRPDVDPARLVYYGRSLGGALAIDLATAHLPAALITESTFTSVAALVADGAYVDLPASFVSESSWDSLAKIGDISAPYLAFHGTSDGLVQPKYSQQLTAAHRGITLLVLVPGADHTNLPETMGLPQYQQQLASFIDPALPSP
jgi:pimeloyl-ACP methyl ester carboxylesterase